MTLKTHYEGALKPSVVILFCRPGMTIGDETTEMGFLISLGIMGQGVASNAKDKIGAFAMDGRRAVWTKMLSLAPRNLWWELIYPGDPGMKSVWSLLEYCIT